MSVALSLNNTVRLTVPRGIDFDDADYGYKEEDKDPGKVRSVCSGWKLSLIMHI